MAISPPSDLVLDVVRAADPMELQAAQEKLKANRAAFAANSLADKGAGFGAAMDKIGSAEFLAGSANAHTDNKGVKMPEAYRKFEASVLTTFVKSMLPTESEEVYGKGNAGEIWKSMMAEQFADVMSKNGGIGIAEQMFSQSVAKAQSKGIVNASTDPNDHSMAMSMVADFERKTLDVSATDNNKA